MTGSYSFEALCIKNDLVECPRIDLETYPLFKYPPKIMPLKMAYIESVILLII